MLNEELYTPEPVLFRVFSVTKSYFLIETLKMVSKCPAYTATA